MPKKNDTQDIGRLVQHLRRESALNRELEKVNLENKRSHNREHALQGEITRLKDALNNAHLKRTQQEHDIEQHLVQMVTDTLRQDLKDQPYSRPDVARWNGLLHRPFQTVRQIRQFIEQERQRALSAQPELKEVMDRLEGQRTIRIERQQALSLEMEQLKAAVKGAQDMRDVAGSSTVHQTTRLGINHLGRGRPKSVKFIPNAQLFEQALDQDQTYSKPIACMRLAIVELDETNALLANEITAFRQVLENSHDLKELQNDPQLLSLHTPFEPETEAPKARPSKR